MSYELYYIETADRPLDQAGAIAYLEALPHCKVEHQPGTAAFQALYENKRTGVYWLCEYSKPDESDGPPYDATVAEAPPGSRWSGLAFNLNFARPHFFGLEAMPFACGIARDLEMLVFDPQGDGRIAPAQLEQLLSSWTKGNEFGAKDLATKRMPRDASHSMWQYNSNADLALEVLTDGRYQAWVPTIMPFVTKENPTSVLRVATWAWDVLSGFPPCDVVILRIPKKPTLIQRLQKQSPFEIRFAAWSDFEAETTTRLKDRRLGTLPYRILGSTAEQDYLSIVRRLKSESGDNYEMVNDSMFVDGPTAGAGGAQP